MAELRSDSARPCNCCNDLQEKKPQISFRYSQLQDSYSLAVGPYISVSARESSPVEISVYSEVETFEKVKFILYSNAKESVDFIHGNLRTCLETHKHCPKPGTTTLPKRILQIGTSEDFLLRLVESGTAHAEYATLSYCWGGEQWLQTTNANLRNMLGNIPYDALPIAFQQAIQVSRKLGIGYLWIDSLCIIQDSQDDWERESYSVAEYYENSILNLWLASTSNPKEPFLGERASTWRPKTLTIPDGEGQHQILARRVTEDYSTVDILFSRAWAWQEAVLSPRRVYFTGRDLVWACSVAIVTDTGRPASNIEVTHSIVHGKRSISEFVDSITALGRESKEYETISQMTWLWAGIVWDHSHRQVTHKADRLPAISGIAKKMNDSVPDRYLARLWARGLPTQLCWMSLRGLGNSYQVAPQRLDYQHSEYVAPSWSWASIRGGAWYWSVHYVLQSDVVVIDAACEVPGLNPFGRVTSGYLCLRGKTVTNTLVCTDPSLRHSYKIHGLSKDSFHPDCVLAERGGNVFRALEGLPVTGFTAKVQCLYLGYEKSREEHEEVTSYSFLALGLSCVEGCYCRVGLIRVKGQLDIDEDGSRFAGLAEEEFKII
ncbi:heterokaryon incompatibility protein-domain-containing protein [Xylariales sp. PMI_506]|nr:heterokaryon incompatibility protein-domain-containing protein [Xylariales sp. PMI_506]